MGEHPSLKLQKLPQIEEKAEKPEEVVKEVVVREQVDLSPVFERFDRLEEILRGIAEFLKNQPDLPPTEQKILDSILKGLNKK